jgi:hypothetical protein
MLLMLTINIYLSIYIAYSPQVCPKRAKLGKGGELGVRNQVMGLI